MFLVIVYGCCYVNYIICIVFDIYIFNQICSCGSVLFVQLVIIFFNFKFEIDWNIILIKIFGIYINELKIVEYILLINIYIVIYIKKMFEEINFF